MKNSLPKVGLFVIVLGLGLMLKAIPAHADGCDWLFANAEAADQACQGASDTVGIANACGYAQALYDAYGTCESSYDPNCPDAGQENVSCEAM